jgi:hypothetical protein
MALLHDAAPVGDRGGLPASADAKLAEDVGHVHGGGLGLMKSASAI